MSEETTTKKHQATMKEVEETLSRISSHKGVQSVMIMNRHGAILQSTWNEADRLEHASLLLQLAKTASVFISSLDENDELSFLTLRSKKQYEIMVAPDKEYLLVVLQKHAATATTSSTESSA